MRKARTSRKMRSTTVSQVTPMPPRICSERSTTRKIASEQITLAIELSRRRALALIEQPRRVPDGKPGRVDVHRVVGQHEAHALVLAERLAERLRLRAYSVAMSWARMAEPSQRMQCVSRAGASRTWA